MIKPMLEPLLELFKTSKIHYPALFCKFPRPKFKVKFSGVTMNEFTMGFGPPLYMGTGKSTKALG
jgi:hypothetical protein